MDAADRIVEHLQSKKLNNIRKILELGCGIGYFTKILKDSFPESEITGFDKEENSSKKVLSLTKKNHWFNITEKKIEEEKETYDMVTLGGLAKPLWWHFGIHKEDYYRDILSSMNYYLKNNGYFLLVFETYNHHTNPAEKNYNDMMNFSCGDLSRDDYLDERLSHDILDLTIDSLNSIGNFEIESVRINDDEAIPERGLKSCVNAAKDKLKSTYLYQKGIEWEKKSRAESIQLFKSITDNDLSDLLEQHAGIIEKAEEIDNSIKEHGIEYSNFTIVLARKREF